MTQICKKCFLEKKLEDFHKYKFSKSGRRYHCKECDKIDCRIRYEERKKNRPNLSNERYEKNKVYYKDYYQINKEKNRDKIRAQRIINSSIYRNKTIKPKSCSVCKKESKRIEAHHEDYHQPYNVIWVCKKCHANFDLKRREKQ